MSASRCELHRKRFSPSMQRRGLERLESRVLLTTVYVDSNAPGPARDGATWDTAYVDLQLALAAASVGDEIRVADGVYKPTSGADRAATFQLKDDVIVRGGYAGWGAADPDERDVTAFETTLSGDLGMQNDFTENSFHVVTASGTTPTTVLDGVTITYGNCNGSREHQNGGGIYNVGGDFTLQDCTIYGNTGTGLGAGMYNIGSAAPLVQGCSFIINSTNSFGGAMYNDGASPTLEDCGFRENYADSGGGIYNTSASTTVIRDCEFVSNRAAGFGGGALHNLVSSAKLFDCSFVRNSGLRGTIQSISSSSTFQNCSFSGSRDTCMRNEASNVTLVGCVFAGNELGTVLFNTSGSSVVLTNCTFTGNTGNGLYYPINNGGGASTSLLNCILWGNVVPAGGPIASASGSVTVGNSDIQGGWAGSGNIDADPLFIRTPDAGADGYWGSADDDYGDLRLQTGSPCLDTGSNAAVPFGTLTDLAGDPRFSDIAGVNDPGSIVDMGAYERQGMATFSAINGMLLYEVGQQLRVGFSNGPDAATVQEGDLMVLNLDTMLPVSFSAVISTDSATQSATWSLSSPLPDGNYRASLAAGSVDDLSANPLSPPFSFDFFILAADANRDRRVDVLDLVILANNWMGTGKTFSQGDFNGDGVVNQADLGILAVKWQQKLDPPAVPSAPAPTTAGRRTPARSPTRVIHQLEPSQDRVI